jgi:hypothetical protein
LDIGQTQFSLEFRLELDEYLEFVRSQETRTSVATRWIVSALGLLLILTLLLLPFAVKNIPGEIAFGLLVVLPFAVFMVILPWYSRPVRTAKGLYQRAWFKTQTVVIADHGIQFTTLHDETSIDWAGFHRYTETPSQFQLFMGMVVYILPKRAFTDEQIALFRVLLDRNIGKEVPRPKSDQPQT